MATTFTVLAEPARRHILDLLLERPRPVGELVDSLGLTQPGTSKHLRVLREAGLVQVRPDAQRRVYELSPGPLAEVDAWLAPYRRLWEGSLDALERHLESVTDELRARLAELTLRDAHRLKRSWTGRGAAATRRGSSRRSSAPRRAWPPAAPPSRRSPIRPSCRSARGARTCWRRSATTRSSWWRGRPGSGKTTQIPKLCLELGRGVRGAIAHTQPRRLAARTVSERIADELKRRRSAAPVGFAVRFSDRSSEDTLVRLMTDGLLLAEIHRDPLLRRYDTVIVDEAHERSLNIDFLLGYLARILPQPAGPEGDHHLGDDRPAALRRHFGGAPVVEVSGRTYPVEVRYRGPPRRPRPIRPTRSATPSRSCCASAAATCSCSCPASGRSATPPRSCAAGCPTTSSCCRCTRGSRPPTSSGCSSRTAGGASCSPPTSPRRR